MEWERSTSGLIRARGAGLLACAAWISIALIFAAMTPCAAQQAPVPPGADEEAREDVSNQLRTDRRTVQHLELLRQHTQNGQLPAVRQQLRLLQQADATLLVPKAVPADASGASTGGLVWQPLYAAVFEAVHQLPADQQRQLQTVDQTVARLELANLLRRGDWQRLVQLILQFPATDVAYQVHLLWAQQHRDRGHQLGVRFWLQPLTQPGVPEPWHGQAQKILNQMAQATPSEPQVDGAAALRPSESDSVVDATSVVNSIPRHIGWTSRQHMPPLFREILDRLADITAQLRMVMWSNWTPVIDNDRVYVRTLRGVKAIDRRRGTTDWSWAARTPLDADISGSAASVTRSQVMPAQDGASGLSALERTVVANLLIRNGIVGRMSSDSQRVYLIAQATEDISPNQSTRFPQRSPNPPQLPPSEMVALDKATGRRLWSAGGELIEESFGNDMTQAWIAGAPAVAGRFLYAVMEQDESVFLSCLSSESGEFQWKVPMAFPGTQAVYDPARRMTPVIPLSQQGLVFTSTGTGWTMAVDTLTKTILWASRDDQPLTEIETRLMRGRRFMITAPKSLRESWPAHEPLLAGDRLIQFDGEGRQVLTLNAFTGELVQRIQDDRLISLLYADAGHLVYWTVTGVECVSPLQARTLWKIPFSNVRGAHPVLELLQDARRRLEQAQQNGDILAPGPPGEENAAADPLEAPPLSSELSSAVPVGRGALWRGVLLIPLTGGTLLPVQLDTGEQLPLPSDLESQPSWGDLLAFEDFLFRYHPAAVSMLADAALPPESTDLLQQVQRLADQGAWSEALAILEAASPSVFTQEAVRQRHFELLKNVSLQAMAHVGESELLDSDTRSPLPEAPSMRLQQVQQWLNRAQQVSRTDAERALLLQLNIRRLRLSGDEAEAVALILGGLAENEVFRSRLVAAELLVTGLLSEQADGPHAISGPGPGSGIGEQRGLNQQELGAGRLSRQQPLDGWLLDELLAIRSLATPDLQQQIDTRLRELPDLLLLKVSHLVVYDELLRRVDHGIAEQQCTETLVHLLLQTLWLPAAAADERVKTVKEESAAGTSAQDRLSDPSRELAVLQRLIRWRQLLIEGTARQRSQAISSAHGVRIRQMLSSLILDVYAKAVQKELTEQSQWTEVQPHIQDVMAEQQQAVVTIRERLLSWPATPATALPVTSNLYSQQNEQPLHALRTTDSFLRQFIWEARVNPAIVMAQPLAVPQQEPWTLAAPFAISSPYINTAGHVDRCGSVLTIFNSQRVQAYSVVDQRTLWDRAEDRNRARTISVNDENSRLFEDYTIYSRSALGLIPPGELTICGSAFRWSCVQWPDRLEVIDSLTGEPVWSMSGAMTHVYTIATADRVILLDSARRSIECFAIHNGAPLPNGALRVDDVIHAVSAVDTDLVILRPRRVSANPRVLEWLHPGTGSVTRRLELSDVSSFQLIDGDTLLGLGARQGFLVSLHSGDLQPIQVPDLPAETLAGPADAAQPEAARPEPAPPERERRRRPPAFEAAEQSARIFTFADPVNLYMTRLIPQHRPDPLRMMGVRVAPLNSWLQVIDRQSGQLRWQVDARDMTTATYDSWSAPVLVLVQLENTQGANPGGFLGRPAGWRLMCRGLLKSTGQTVFEQSLSYRMPISHIRVSTAADHVIDFDAFGNKIRFVPVDPQADDPFGRLLPSAMP